jgi:hypothetical protein
VLVLPHSGKRAKNTVAAMASDTPTVEARVILTTR